MPKGQDTERRKKMRHEQPPFVEGSSDPELMAED